MIPMDILEALAGEGVDNGELKELKVKLPLRHHIKLHSLKLVRKEPISETVLKALNEYFARMESKENAPDVAPSGPSEVA
ncbi:MAG: hypothetical protein KY455_11440 [Euryarchaeota archaeon]|nr:hypothetical protein [Euryarchaeota archaeon]